MIQCSVQAELKDAVKQNLEKTRSLIEGSKLTPSEKLLQHELLKHRRTMAGLIIHKAAQIVEPSLKESNICTECSSLGKMDLL